MAHRGWGEGEKVAECSRSETCEKAGTGYCAPFLVVFILYFFSFNIYIRLRNICFSPVWVRLPAFYWYKYAFGTRERDS